MTLRAALSSLRGQIVEASESYLSRSYLPAQLRDDDLFLVEFPKSGVTWLTFLVANVNLMLSGDDRAATFFNINDFVPDVQVTRFLADPILKFPGYRCFKSHAPYTRRYRKIVYLVRDPRDVMVSYWVFLNSLRWWRGTLEDLVGHARFGIRAWCSHVSGWLARVDASTSFALLRYEDLLSNTSLELSRLYGHLGIQLGGEVLQAAMERSSIGQMRADEARFAAGHPALTGIEFVRKGDAGGGRVSLEPSLRIEIETQAAAIMARLGYLPNLG